MKPSLDLRLALWYTDSEGFGKMIRHLLLLILLSGSQVLYCQTVLEADGPGNTYELISSILAPGGDAIENPECIHPQFGRHIAEVWDSTLSRYVFEFYSHVTPDNDRCINTDRQRIEIKTYESSPDYLKGMAGETVTYKWKFRIEPGYKPSSSFTHLHQIKPVGGDDGNPLFTLTPRKGTPNKMELIHDNTTKVAIVELSLFEGVWVECTETVKIGVLGTYSMVIRRVSDGSTILSYRNDTIMTMRPDNGFIRPKWGIYRSLTTPSDLRDEAVRFAGFSIQKLTTGIKASQPFIPASIVLNQNYPNPWNPSTQIEYALPFESHVQLTVIDMLGREVGTVVNAVQPAGVHTAHVQGLNLSSGMYIYRLSAGGTLLSKKMIVMK
jgi:hypothetical protein